MPYKVSGAIHEGCVDKDLLLAIDINNFVEIPKGKQRPGCNCIVKKKQACSGECGHGCLYCYAHKEHLYM